jgi:phosphoglycerate dehydrogenase-like enzyme
MKITRSISKPLLFLIFIAVLSQNSLLAGVKILVPASLQEALVDMEENFPELDLVFLGRQDSTKLETDYDAIITLRSYGIAPQKLLRMSKKLRWVHSLSAGVEKIIHIPELRDSEIILTNAKIVQAPEIGDHTFALLLLLTRNLKHYERAMDDGWIRHVPPRLPIIELTGKTMLIIGIGGIGRQVAQRAAAFEMRVLAVDPKDIPHTRDVEYVGKPDELNDLLPQADVVVSAVPHTTESEGMLGKEQFDLMKDGVYVINVSRGKIVQTDALVAALESGKVRGAGLDVTNPEPLPKNHPLWKMDNVIITPHIATVSDIADNRRIKLVRDNIERFVTGRRLRNMVNKQVQY